MVFLLTKAVQRMKHGMMEHPNMVRALPRETKCMDGKTRATGWRKINFGELEMLKIAMLEEMYEELLHSTKIKRELIHNIRSGIVQEIEGQHSCAPFFPF